MTLDEFDQVQPDIARELRRFTGNYKGGTKIENYLNRDRYLDVVGVYAWDQGSTSWAATVEQMGGDRIETEWARWDPEAKCWKWMCWMCGALLDPQARCPNPECDHR